MDTDSQDATEEIIYTGDDLMTGLPSPMIPADLAPQILEGVELCSSQLRKLFECLHKNDIEPFCQDEILIYRRCSQKRPPLASLLAKILSILASKDSTLRGKLYKAEETLGRVLPEDLQQERQAQHAADSALLERKFVLASGMEGVEGFRRRWSLNGQLLDSRKRRECFEQGMASKQEQQEVPKISEHRSKWKQ